MNHSRTPNTVGLSDTPAWAVAKAAVIADFPRLGTHQFQPPHIPAPSRGPAAPFASRVQPVAVGIGPQGT